MMKSDGAEAAADAFDGAAKEAALDGLGKFGEGADVQEDDFRGDPEIDRFQAVDFQSPVILFGAGPVGCGGEDFRQ
jgi:hypothetical protein